jgi:hypothetical protein
MIACVIALVCIIGAMPMCNLGSLLPNFYFTVMHDYDSDTIAFLDVVGLTLCLLSISSRRPLPTHITLTVDPLRITARLRLAKP